MDTDRADRSIYNISTVSDRFRLQKDTPATETVLHSKSQGSQASGVDIGSAQVSN